MDGLLVVLLIVGWIYSNSKKKKKTPRKNTVLSMMSQNAAARRAERAAQMHQERLQREELQPPIVQPPVGEGESEQLTRQEPLFRGSMENVSTEGECLCDPVLEHEGDKVDPKSVYAGEIGREPLLDFSSKGILQGVVMSEVLQKPACARRMR